MSSKELSETPKVESESLTHEALSVTPFLTLNQQPFAELLTFIDFAEGFTIGFVEVNFLKDRDILIEALQQHPQNQDVQFAVLDFSDAKLRFLRDALLQETPKLSIESGKKLVLVLKGLENAIGMTGSYPPVLQDLNYIRDAFPKSVPHPMLLCLPDYAVSRLAKFAPDFWAWKSGVFRFTTAQSSKDHALTQTLQSERIRGSLELPEKQERIDLLQRLLMEYPEETKQSLSTRIDILNELGMLHNSQGEPQRAQDALNEALALATDDENENLIRGKSTSLHCLAGIYAQQGQVEQAIAFYQQSLEICERIGDAQGKAATLHQLAGIYADQGQVEQAIAFYQQSLEIQERIGNAQGKAATLNNLAVIYADQGEVEQAIAFYQQSLEIIERIGDAQGKAATLNNLAVIYAKQGQVEQAIAFYQQSLEICERIGDAYGEAATLHQLAGIYARQGQVEQAIDLFRQSLEIKERIGDAYGKAATLAMLGQLLADERREFSTALKYLQESLEILQRLKSPNAETVRGIIDRVQQMAEA